MAEEHHPRTLKDLSHLSEAEAAREMAKEARREKKVDSAGRAYATGKRKNAVARVWIKPGKGKIVIDLIPENRVILLRCLAYLAA